MLRDVKAFHDKFKVPQGPGKPRTLGPERAQVRAEWMLEEFCEYLAGQGLKLVGTTHRGLRIMPDPVAKVSLGETADALVDLVYMTLGTALETGLDEACFVDLWNDVHRANMGKVSLAGNAKASKPANWKGPLTWPILIGHGAAMTDTGEEPPPFGDLEP